MWLHARPSASGRLAWAAAALSLQGESGPRAFPTQGVRWHPVLLRPRRLLFLQERGAVG